jgi:hypothetical protein
VERYLARSGDCRSAARAMSRARLSTRFRHRGRAVYETRSTWGGGVPQFLIERADHQRMACRNPGHPSGIQRHPPGQNLVTQLLHALDLVTASFASLFRSLVGRDQPVLVKRHAFQAAGADARRGPVLLEQIPVGHRRPITAHALTGLWPHLPRLTGTGELSGLIRDGLFRQTLLGGLAK